jgi:hypothetical protein
MGHGPYAACRKQGVRVELQLQLLTQHKLLMLPVKHSCSCTAIVVECWKIQHCSTAAGWEPYIAFVREGH